ncbi:MAG: hypothetical protein H0W64_04895 [Gammaproteobacteria bacterium]|nr:hypothetical protein [Gammaproteobacteria bacterium]
MTNEEQESTFHDELEGIYNTTFNICKTDKLLYHYTNYKSLLGILSSKQIWLTDYRYLNDSSEIQYSYQEIAPIVFNNLNLLTIMPPEVMTGLSTFLINHFYRHYNFYVFSMCARDHNGLNELTSFS